MSPPYDSAGPLGAGPHSMGREGIRVSVVIPTMAAAARGRSLLRAIDCVLAQEAVSAIPIVVVNGTRFDPDLLAALQARADIRCLHLEEPGLPNAIHVGARNADTEFHAFLDDDDYYLPHALAARVRVLDGDPRIDAVATTGYREIDGDRTPITCDAQAIQRDPLAALFDFNWLASCGGLYRTASVPPAFFADLTQYMEWTLVALRLALEKRVVYLEDRTFVVCDSPDSLSKSPRHTCAAVELMERILQFRLPAHVRRLAERKYIESLHWAADASLAENDRKAAWGYHLRSVRSVRGLRYLTFTRHLFHAGPSRMSSPGGPDVRSAA